METADSHTGESSRNTIRIIGMHFLCRQEGYFRWDKCLPQDPSLFVRVISKRLDDLPTQWGSIQLEESWDVFTMKESHINFLINTGTQFLVLPFSPVSDPPKAIIWGSLSIIYPASFLLMGKSLSLPLLFGDSPKLLPLFGKKYLLAKLKVKFLSLKQHYCLLLIESKLFKLHGQMGN